MKKDPGIPNLFPYKDKILHEIEETKRRREEDVQRRKDDARARREAAKTEGDDVMGGTAAEEDDDALLDYEDDDESEAEMGDAVSQMVVIIFRSMLIHCVGVIQPDGRSFSVCTC